MAHSLSAKKRVRQNEKRRLHNKSQKNALKALVKRVLNPEKAAAAKAPEGAKAGDKKPATPLVAVQKKLDRMAAKGILHPNTAARRKSRLARAAKKSAKAPAAPAAS